MSNQAYPQSVTDDDWTAMPSLDIYGTDMIVDWLVRHGRPYYGYAYGYGGGAGGAGGGAGGNSSFTVTGNIYSVTVPAMGGGGGGAGGQFADASGNTIWTVAGNGNVYSVIGGNGGSCYFPLT